jgi:3-methylcrotonyl-CoA carboxylase alpha subunit
LEKLTMAFKVMVDGRAHEVEIVRRRPHLVIRIDGREHEVSLPGDIGDGRQTIEIAGLPVHFTRAHAGDHAIVRLAGRTFEASLVDPRSEAEAGGGGPDHIKAPMPGAVVSVHKAVGDAVKRGETIVTIESMKLQTALVAPRDGVIAELNRKEGESFEKDEVIARLEATAGEV